VDTANACYLTLSSRSWARRSMKRPR
jgi:hypothetical protein